MTFILSNPFYQAISYFSISILFLFFNTQQAEKLWKIQGVIFGIYMLSSSLFIFNSPSVWDYFFSTLAFSILYLVLIGCFIQLTISLRKINGSNEAAMIFLIFIYHPILLLFFIFIRWLFMVWCKDRPILTQAKYQLELYTFS